MVTAMYAARNIAGSSYDVWDVNVDGAYHEEVKEADASQGDRLVPTRVGREVDAALIRQVFARYDPVALGVSISIIVGLCLFLATTVLLMRGGEPVGPNVSLLGHYFLGYTVSWMGALVGLVEGAIGGFTFGYLLARLINFLIVWHERALIHTIEARSVDPLTGGE